jgi:2-desacetyl-2-hydroxyethyl bacteriochlorophyllide A dehydrogenase
MPTFPGMGYPLVPGYESVGRVVAAGPKARLRVGERVFVPGAQAASARCAACSAAPPRAWWCRRSGWCR